MPLKNLKLLINLKMSLKCIYNNLKKIKNGIICVFLFCYLNKTLFW